jgi:SAM-dependent methyltransferase
VKPFPIPPGDTDICFSVEESSFWFAHRNDIIAAAVKRFLPCGAIFDVGSGNAFVAKALADHGYEVVPIEPSREGAAHAGMRGLTNVICGTLGDARFHPPTLGAAGLFDVLEHIDDDVAFLHSIRPLLMDGAPLYLTVPAGPLLWSIDDEAAGLSQIRSPDAGQYTRCRRVRNSLPDPFLRAAGGASRAVPGTAVEARDEISG